MFSVMARSRVKPRDTFPLTMVTIRTDLYLFTLATRRSNQNKAIAIDSIMHPINQSLLLYINHHPAHQGIRQGIRPIFLPTMLPPPLRPREIRETAPIKRTTLSKKKNSSANVGLQGWEKWRWDVADEVYAAMNSAEKKQIRNRCGARTFRAKKKGMSSPPLSIPQRLTISGGYVKSGRC
jgi:hypothetical protein